MYQPNPYTSTYTRILQIWTLNNSKSVKVMDSLPQEMNIDTFLFTLSDKKPWAPDFLWFINELSKFC